MKTPNQSQQIIEAHRNDLATAEEVLKVWKNRVRDIKKSLRAHEKHAAKVEKLAAKDK
jgi:predicted translin family RNA/ssDNA-binding protein